MTGSSRIENDYRLPINKVEKIGGGAYFAFDMDVIKYIRIFGRSNGLNQK